MVASARCTVCAGYVAWSYITYDGITVYRCSGEDSWNDKGRYFINTSAGYVEVTPKRHGKEWSYDIVDTERRRLEQEADRINEELEARRQVFLKSQQQHMARYKKQKELDPELQEDDGA